MKEFLSIVALISMFLGGIGGLVYVLQEQEHQHNLAALRLAP
jgi:hypothetical protein